MTREEFKAAIVSALSRALDEPIDQLYASISEDAEREAAMRVYAAVAAALPTGALMEKLLPESARSLPEQFFSPVEEERESHHSEQTWHLRRAPKGLTEAVLKRILTYGVSMPIEEIQKRASDIDPRVSSKTVYNQLNHADSPYERDEFHRWRLVRQIAPSTKPPIVRVEGETPIIT